MTYVLQCCKSTEVLRQGKQEWLTPVDKVLFFCFFRALMCKIDPNMLMPTGTLCTAVSLYRISKLDERS